MAVINTQPPEPVPYTKTVATIVNDFTAAAQASSQQPLNFSIGSVFLALAQAVSGVVDWLQKLYLFALLISRLQTSSGAWVDTFAAQYMPVVAGTNSPRLPAAPANGAVIFSRYADESQAVIPVGTLVATYNGSQVYQVYADTANSAYSATIIPGGGFIIPAGQQTLTVNVQALNPGTAANVAANTITTIQSSVIGVDSVTNPAPLTTGFDQESDVALKARFQLWILSLSGGTTYAIQYAVSSLQQGLVCTIHENIDPNGATDYGSLTIYIDDGSGDPPSALVTNAQTAINGPRGRAAGVRINVLGASILDATISMTVAVAAGYNQPLVLAAVGNAVGAYVNSLGLENPLPYSMLEHVAYNASPGVTNVTSVLLNNGTSDLTPAMGQTIKVSGTVTIN